MWMCIVVLFCFRKLYGKIEEDLYEDDDVVVNFMNNYNIYIFGGMKGIVFFILNWLGGKNDFFGIVYISVGFFCLVILFIIILLYLRNFR